MLFQLDLPWDISEECLAHLDTFPVLVDPGLVPQEWINSTLFLGILFLFSVFCWMQQLLPSQLRRLVTSLAWVMWSNPEHICAIPSRSFFLPEQHSGLDRTGMPGCVLLTDQQNNWNLLEVQLSLSSSFLSCVPDWPSLPFYWAWQQLSSKRHWWECVVAHTISLPAPMDNLNSCDPTLKCQY